MYIPSDSDMLLSLINTKLRDEYPSFDDLCDSEALEKSRILEILEPAGYKYDESQNQFK